MSKESIWAEFVRRMKIAGGIGLLALFLLIAGAAMAYTAPDDVTYSNDEFTVANSSDGQQTVVTFEVTTSLKENADTATRKERMDEMSRVTACANARLDGYIQENSKERVENANLQEVVITCETSDVKVERITVAGDTI